MYVSSISIDAVIDALAAFMQPFMLGGEITRGQVNRVPLADVPSAMLTEMRQVDIDTPYLNFDGTTDSATISGGKRIDVQIDLFGTHAAEICATLKLAFRSPYAFNVMPPNIKPLYIDDGINSQLVTGENQYETRWTLTAVMQYNPTVTVPQQFADVASVAIIDAVEVL
jgi:hypothetical protein